jgi:hypothetical protein
MHPMPAYFRHCLIKERKPRVSIPFYRFGKRPHIEAILKRLYRRAQIQNMCMVPIFFQQNLNKACSTSILCLPNEGWEISPDHHT